MAEQQPDAWGAIDAILAEHDLALVEHRRAHEGMLATQTTGIELAELCVVIFEAAINGEDAAGPRQRRTAILAARDAALDRLRAAEAQLVLTAQRRNQVARVVGFAQPAEWKAANGIPPADGAGTEQER